MKRLFSILLVTMATVSLSAALPPLSQSRREIEAILSSHDLEQFIPSSDQIMQIVKTPTGYLIMTNNRIVPVSITYIPRQKLGPAKFSIRFHKPIDIRSKASDKDVDSDLYEEEPHWKNR